MIELQNIKRVFGSTVALSDVSLEIREGSFTSLLGPSGCGKSTTLRIIAGLDRPTSGQVLLNGRDVAGLSASQRNIAMVFQSYALYPHMTVWQNIALPLVMRNKTRLERLPLVARLLPSARRKSADIAAQVRRIAEMLEIESLLDRKPGTLSGGQKQRAAVGRALVRDPFAFLLDEPLSNLDAKLRLQMRSELVDIHRRTGRTFVYVTHDQAEAMSMSDRIAVFMDGRILQTGTPHDLYERPATRQVAAFIGDYPINLIELDLDQGRLPPPFEDYSVQGARQCRSIVLGLRAETLYIADGGPLRGQVERIEYLGSSTNLSVRLGADTTLQAIFHAGQPVPNASATVRLSFDPRQAHLFDGETGARLEAGLVAHRDKDATGGLEHRA
jgi:multiple sugar transport system ATP-binding protein